MLNLFFKLQATKQHRLKAQKDFHKQLFFLVRKDLEHTLWKKKSLGKSRTEQFSHGLVFVGFYTMKKIIKDKDTKLCLFLHLALVKHRD